MSEITNIPKSKPIRMRVASSLRIIGRLKSKTGIPFDLSGCTITGKIGSRLMTALILAPASAGVFQYDINPIDVPGVISTDWNLDLNDSTSRVIPLVAGPFNAVV